MSEDSYSDQIEKVYQLVCQMQAEWHISITTAVELISESLLTLSEREQQKESDLKRGL